MFQFIEPTARRLTMATVASAILFATPLYAATNALPQIAQATTAPSADTGKAASDSSAPAKRNRGQNIEARIKRLHDDLKITPAQEPQWNQVAQVMRDSAATMRSIIQKRRANAQTMTAVDDLHSYQEAAATHAQELQKLIPVFQALYDTMSDDQKKNADVVFRQHRRRQRQAHGGQ